MVLRSSRYQALARDEGDDDPAVVGVFGIVGKDAGSGTGCYVGGDACSGIRGRALSGGGILGVLPFCEARALNGGSERKDGNLSGASGTLQRLPMVQGMRWADAR